jgi:hypothetical protein
MRYRVRRQDDNGHVFTVPHDGVWYEHLEAAAAVKRELEQRIHKQTYWIEDENGCVMASPAFLPPSG